MKNLLPVILVLILAISVYACVESTPSITPQPSPQTMLPSFTPEAISPPPSKPEITPAPGRQKPGSQIQPHVEPTPAPEPRWSTRAPLLEPNSEFAVAELDGKIYVLGGYPAGRITVTTVQVYDSHTDRWELTTPLPQPNNHGMAAAANGKVYIIGGQTTASGDLIQAGYLDTVFEYDPVTTRWSPRAPMPTKRSAGATAVIGDKIYVAGGRPPRGNDFAVYDTRENKWTTLPNMPTARNHIAAAAINGKIYVVGGRFGGGFSSEVTDILEAFDPVTATWERKSPMPTSRGGINGVAVDNCFHVWGGEGNVNHPTGLFEQHEVYNALTDTWKRLDPMPIVVHGVTGAAFINGLIYIPGGGTAQGGSSGSTIHQVFRPEECD